MQSVKLIGHRGSGQTPVKRGQKYSSGARENTLASLRMAFWNDADGVEFDVRKTRDEEIILQHDPEISGRAVRHMTYDEISSSYPGKSYPPKLGEVLRLFPNQFLDIEIKELSDLRDVLNIVQDRKNTVFTSFSEEVVRRIRGMGQPQKAGLLIGGRVGDVLGRGDFRPWKKFEECGADFLVLEYHLLPLLRRGLQTRKIPFWVWNVGNVKQGIRVEEAGGEAIITDFLPELRQYFKK